MVSASVVICVIQTFQGNLQLENRCWIPSYTYVTRKEYAGHESRDTISKLQLVYFEVRRTHHCIDYIHLSHPYREIDR